MPTYANQTLVTPLVDGENHIVAKRLYPFAPQIKQTIATSATNEVKLRMVIGQDIVFRRNNLTSIKIYKPILLVATDTKQCIAIGIHTITIQADKMSATDM